MSFQTILYEKLEHVALITLNRPERLNAINQTMLSELQTACDVIERDNDIRAVVLTGAGRTFSSGFDLKEQAETAPTGIDVWRPILKEDFKGIMRFWYLSKPTIAAVRGHALAGAFEMTLACDMTIAAEDSVFGEPELKFGAGIVALLLPWHTGPKQAKELLLTAHDQIDAERALALGLINKIVTTGQEVSAALKFARRMARMNPDLMSQTKAAINRTYQIMGLDEALAMALDVDLLIEGVGTDDKREFLARTRKDGLRSAIVWRDSRIEDER